MKIHSKNILSLFGFDLANRLIGFVVTAYIARSFGADGFGVINYGMAILAFMLLFANPGLHTVGTRLVSQKSVTTSTLIRKITVLKFFLAVITCAIVVCTSLIFLHERVLRTIVVLYALSVFPFAFQIEWFFQGKERIDIIGINRFLGTIVFTLGIVAFANPTNLSVVPISFFVSTAVNAAALFVSRKKVQDDDAESSTNRNIDSLPLRSLLQQALPIGAAGILAQVVLNLPVFLLGIFSTTTEIGNYSAAAKIVFFLLVIDRAIYFLFFPLMARNFALSPDNVPTLVHRAIRYTLIGALPVCAGGVILAAPLVRLAFSTMYDDAVVLFQILIFYFLFTILNSIFAYILIAGGKEKRYSALTISLSLILIAAIVAVTALWNATGAACAMAIGEGIMMTAMIMEVKKIVTLKNFSFIFTTVSATLIMAVTVFILRSYPFVAIPLGVVVYFSLLIGMKELTKNDFLFLKERLL